MKFLISIICSFLLISAPTNEQLDFEKVIHENYDEYYYVVSEETTVGDVVIVVGSIDKKLYISGFIYNTTYQKHQFKLTSGNIYQEFFYKVPLKEEFEISVESPLGTNFKTYRIENMDYDDFLKMDINQGKGKNHFPTEELKLDIFDIYLILTLIFIGIIAVFTIILSKIYQNKKMNLNFNNQPVTTVIDIPNDDFEIERKTKEEQMLEAYDDFKQGKITEAELNNRLRAIWWSDDDD